MYRFALVLAFSLLMPVSFSFSQEAADQSQSDEVTLPEAAAPVPEVVSPPAAEEKPAEVPAETPPANEDAAADKETAPAENAEEQKDEGAQQEEFQPVKKESTPDKVTYELSAGSVTVDNEQWTRIAFGIDVPIWKFGVFFDIEAFLDQKGNFSKKGWDFKDEPFEAVMRKIRYVRFGHEDEPLFVKVGGLSSVTIGHGFIVDRFTNMLHYPDQKLLGAQVYVKDITPIGLTIQVMAADLPELRDKYEGGVGAARLAIKPLLTTSIPILKNLTVGGMYAMDRNTFAPARDWKLTGDARLFRELQDSGLMTSQMIGILQNNGKDPAGELARADKEDSIKALARPFGIAGIDLNLPLITSKLLSLDIYAQSGMRDDSITGWGIGAPGVALKIWRLSAAVEYRHVEGRFTPGFFNPYYLDERLSREPEISTKADRLDSVSLNGVYGRLGFDIANVLVIDGAYQYMIGELETQKDQRFEITGNIGSLILNKIPKIRKLEAYLYKTHIGSEIVKYDSLGIPVITSGAYTYDGFFEKTPYLYYGYRLGFAISEGATLICDTRFGYTREKGGALKPNNNVSVQTAFTF